MAAHWSFAFRSNAATSARRHTLRTVRSAGFTLIELLVVIAIAGILATILVPNLILARNRAFDAEAQSCAKQIAVAEEAFLIDIGMYAAVFATLDTGIVATCRESWVTAGGSPDAYSYTVVHDGAGGTSSFVVSPHGIQRQ